MDSTHVTGQDLEEVLDRPLGAPAWQAYLLPKEETESLQLQLDEMGTEIERWVAESLSNGIELRLERLGKIFGLSAFERDVILLCLAPHIDPAYEPLYAFIQGDMSLRTASAGLSVNLLCPDLESRLTAYEYFSADAPLNRWRLVQLGDGMAPLPRRGLRLDERILRYLLGQNELDGQLDRYAELVSGEVSSAQGITESSNLERCADLARNSQLAVFYFYGPHGVGKASAARELARNLGRPLLTLHGLKLALAPPETCLEIIRRASREALLQGAQLYWEDFNPVLGESMQPWRSDVFKLLVEHPMSLILGGEIAWDAGDLFDPRPFTSVHFSLPAYTERVRLWAQYMQDSLAGEQIELLASRYRLTASQIHAAAVTADNRARWRDPHQPQIVFDDVLEAIRQQSNPKLASLAQKITPHYTWDEIVLPSEQKAQLHELCNQVRLRSRVLEHWGFGQKMAQGKGINSLFTGPPGTGKTMTADVMAGELDMDLYKIDLSMVVSKYIGETEKNLARIFEEASAGQVILFFDEADALFGKRTEVKDSHDRYANLEISYLLQKMDEYDGLVILATNLRQNMDKAFMRRMQFVVEFPFPDVADRLKIWQQIWPESAPRAEDLDLELLARQLDISGGSIRNIVLAAAYLAAAESHSINMGHIERAAENEYKKIGKFAGN